MLTGKEFISDYDSHRKDIEKWFSIKCPEKYRKFAELLKNGGEDPTWVRIVDLYRYDKRLIFNCYRYLSFLEEYLRAIVVRQEGGKESYDQWQDRTLGELEERIKTIIKSGGQISGVPQFENYIGHVRNLRNAISHNKIVLELPYRECINSLLMMLPETYRKGFREEINDCAKELDVSDRWLIKYD